MSDSEQSIRQALEGLRRPLGLTRAGLFAEALTRTFWPVWTLLIAMIAALAFGAGALEPRWAVRTVVVIWAVAFAWFLIRGLLRVRLPGHGEALARLDSSLSGRPLAALADEQAIGAEDAESAAVWRAHRLRMAGRLAQIRAVRPDLRLAARDPFALRYVALTALVLAVLFGSPIRVSDVATLAPEQMRFDDRAASNSWEAWIEPPTYTGRPSLYLNEVDRPALTVPEGSRATIRLYGESGVLSLGESVSGEELAEPEAPSHDFEIRQPGRLSVQGPGGRNWEITVEEDAPPEIRLAGELARASGGAMRQPFEARDDYGVVAGEAEIALDLDAVDRRYGLTAEPEPELLEPLVVDLPMPIAGDRDAFEEVLVENFSQHPWANLPVRIQLRAEDALGQTGESQTREEVLPGRRFFDPLAAAVVEMRRDLLWNHDNARRVAGVLRAVSHRPEEGFRDERAYLKLRVALRQLEAGIAEGPLPTEQRDEIAEVLWEVALQIEEGDLADALERLRRAQDRLSEAMRSGADENEIAELMQELREAMRDYLRQRAEQDGAEERDFAEGESMEITGDQLQQMMDRIQELMEQGRMAEAMELLEQLNMMMENMQVVEGDGTGEGGEGQQALEGLGETLRDQQGLSDDTFRDLQERFGQPGPQDAPGPGPGEGDGEGEGEGEGPGDERGDSRGLAERQQELRERLRELEQIPFPGDGTEEGEANREALDEAGRAMERAEEALREGDGAGALDRQAEALDALRDGIRGLGEQLAEERGGEPGTEGAFPGEGAEQEGRDPLGRETGRLGRIGTDDGLLQDGELQDRARELLDEIRRRSGEQDRPEIELDYLRRLLDRF